MKNALLLYLLFSLSNLCNGQNSHSFNITFDSIVLDNQTLTPPEPISTTITSGKSSYFTIIETDTLKIRFKIKFKSNSKRPKNHKIRIDIYENDKWHKPKMKIDIHHFTRFRIRRDQCWGRTGLRYNAGYPYTQKCDCWKGLKGKRKHQFFMSSTFLINK